MTAAPAERRGAAAAAGAKPARVRVRGISIVVALVVSLSALIGLAVLLLLLLVYPIAQRNTLELVQSRSQLMIDSLVARTRDHLDPAKAGIELLGAMIAAGELDPADRERLTLALSASLAGLPQVSSISFVGPELDVVRAFRGRPDDPVTVSDWSDDPGMRHLAARQAGRDDASWGGFFFAEPAGRTYLNVLLPVRRDGSYLGFLIGAVSIRSLSEFLTQTGKELGYHAFILHGRDEVLAHSSLAGEQPETAALSDADPLPRLERLDDPVLRRIWSEQRDRDLEDSFRSSNEVRAVEVEGELYLFFYRNLFDYTQAPLEVGIYLRFAEVGTQIERLRLIPLVGAATLVVALGVAVLLGRSLAAPVRSLGDLAIRIRDLDLDHAPRLKPGLFKELNEAALAFATMFDTLKAFGIYVPRALVLRLIGQDQGHEVRSEVRDITVMFTDVVGFTAMAEHMSAVQLAGLLNSHFTLLNDEVAAEDGTVDKYMGDSLMAFWGAPEPSPDHARRACRAARTIAERLHADNLRRVGLGRAPIRLRIGIHSGRAFVGNVGAPGRVNYTVVGDMVNTADRLEKLSRELIDPDEEVAILVSGDTAAQLGDDCTLTSLGEHQLRGREETVMVYRMTGAPTT